MNKFFNVCFQAGKWFMAVVLIVLLLTGVGLICNIIYKSNNMNAYVMDYKFPTQENEIAVEKQNSDKSVIDEISKQYKDQITAQLKECNVSEKTADIIIKRMVVVEERDRQDFVSNLSQYYKDATKYLISEFKSEYSLSEAEAKQVLNEEKQEINNKIIPDKYFQRYSEQIEARNAEHQKFETQRTTSLIALLVCLCMFVMFLTIPILIRIEENTRR